MEEFKRHVVLACLMAAYIGVFIWGYTVFSSAWGHEHQAGETSEEAAVVEFLRSWKRPVDVAGSGRRKSSCCYADGPYRDCFPVAETRVLGDGTYEIRLATDTEELKNWYRVDPKIMEINQPDPKESPTGQAFACVFQGAVVCYTGGGGT